MGNSWGAGMTTEEQRNVATILIEDHREVADLSDGWRRCRRRPESLRNGGISRTR
jgi:hypothetical protein